MLEKLVNKFGYDKLLHFAFGAVISFVFTNVIMLQDGITGVSNIWVAIAGIVITMILECIKEFIIDATPDKKDILATFNVYTIN